MFIIKTVLLFAALATASSQRYEEPATTPVPILKQINRQNDDGSYSFGYEAGDGSFKIETKYTNGDVAGKYGFIDENGKLKEITYGASSQRGFEPEGPGIMVPPPTLNDPKTAPSALPDGQEDDGQYREDPRIYEDPKYNRRNPNRPSANFNFEAAEPQPQRYQKPSTFRATPTSLFSQAPQQFSQPQYQRQQQYQPPQPQYQQTQPQYQQTQPQYQQTQPQYQQTQPQYQPPQPQYQQTQPQYQSQFFHQQPQFSYSGYTQPKNNYQQQYSGYNQNYNPFQGHPATNFDPTTGSYTINFTG